jgi:hypothetical protein
MMEEGRRGHFTRRRVVLAAGAATVGSIAGCIGSNSDGGGDEQNDDTVEADASGEAESGLIVTDLSHPESVVYDQSVRLLITVENTEEDDVEQPISVRSDGDVVASTRVTLSAGATEQYEFNIPPRVFFSGSYDFTVETDDDSVQSSVAVQNPSPESINWNLSGNMIQR